MSFNLIAKYNGPDEKVSSMIMTRLLPGLTHSCVLSQGDIVRFPNGVQVEVEYIIHEWRPHGSDISPNSFAYGRVHSNLLKEQIDQLKEYGFTPQGGKVDLE
jgi:hypothetical protein